MPNQLGGVFDPSQDVALAGALTVAGGITATGTVPLGYTTGTGGTVTQATSKTTGVTLNKLTGLITMDAAALAAAAEVVFTVTNSLVSATDCIVVNHASGGTAGSYAVGIAAVAAGSFSIVVSNWSAGSLSEAIVIRFLVLKGVSA